VAQQQQGSSRALADTLLALLFVCCGNVANTQRLAAAGALTLLNAVVPVAAGAGAALLQRCCLLLGLAAEAADGTDPAATQQLECSLQALRGVVQKQLESSGRSSSNGVATSAVWAMTKVAAQLLQCTSSSSSSSSNSSALTQQELYCSVLPSLMQLLSSAVTDAPAVDSNTMEAQQQQQQWLVTVCLACCSVLVPAVWPPGPAAEPAAAAAGVEQAKVQLLDMLAAVTNWAVQAGSSSSMSDTMAAIRVSTATQACVNAGCYRLSLPRGAAQAAAVERALRRAVCAPPLDSSLPLCPEIMVLLCPWYRML
jgi:hypothetical protein